MHNREKRTKMAGWLCLLLTIATATGQATAQQPTGVRNSDGTMLYYTPCADGKGCVVTHERAAWPYYGAEKPKGRIVIPDSVRIDGRMMAVVGIGECAFYRCSDISEVVLNHGCREIGVQAFNGCEQMAQIALPSGLRVVDEGAFAYCKALRAIELPESVEKIGISAFAMCEGLQKVEMTEEQRAMCNRLTFWGCTSMNRNGKK